MKRFKKLKLQNRISLIYIILFLFLMVVSNLLIIYLVQRGNNKPLEVAFKERKVLVEEFFYNEWEGCFKWTVQPKINTRFLTQPLS